MGDNQVVDYAFQSLEKEEEYKKKFFKSADDMSDEDLRKAKDDLRKTTFRFVHVGEIKIEPTKWLINHVLAYNQLTAIFGASGSGKSFLAIDWACRIATGMNFHKYKVNRAMPVLYIAGEGKPGISKRVEAWCIRNQVDRKELPLFVSERPGRLVDEEDVMEMKVAIKHVADIYGVPGLIVIDTLAKNMGGGDENSSQEMNTALTSADDIRSRWESTVLIVHHTGHNNKARARGSSAFHAALDTEYKVDKDASRKVNVECTKIRDGKAPEPMAFSFHTVELGILNPDTGEMEDSAILNPTDYEAEARQTPKIRGDYQPVVYETLEELYQKNRENLESSGLSPDSARVSISQLRDACYEKGMIKQRFHQAKKTLVEKGLLVIEHNYVYLSGPGNSVRRPSACPPPKGGGGQSGRDEEDETDDTDGKRTEKRTESGQAETAEMEDSDWSVELF